MLVDSTHTWVMGVYRAISCTIRRGGTTSLFPPTSTPTIAGVEKCGKMFLMVAHCREGRLWIRSLVRKK
jgi:hypothetical protein